VVLETRLREALGRLNPQLPAEALEGGFRRLKRRVVAEGLRTVGRFGRELFDCCSSRKPCGSDKQRRISALLI
jgi:hypothetical protein